MARNGFLDLSCGTMPSFHFVRGKVMMVSCLASFIFLNPLLSRKVLGQLKRTSVLHLGCRFYDYIDTPLYFLKPIKIQIITPLPKRIAELQQTAGPLELGVSKIGMAVSRSNFFITNLVNIHFFILLRAISLQNIEVLCIVF